MAEHELPAVRCRTNLFMLHAELMGPEMRMLSRRVAAIALLSAFVVPMLAGCGGPQPIPIGQRASGHDISPEARADKQGKTYVPPAK